MVEVASNDGYLLQYFVKQGVPVLGIEPAANVAKVAVEKGVPSLVRFFGTELAKEMAAEGRCADLVLGNNVLAQVPDLNDFVEGLKILLKPRRRPDTRISPFVAADRAQRIRHDLPRAFFIFFDADNYAHSWKRTD